jgi:Xaa-Pro aminopeptidase
MKSDIDHLMAEADLDAILVTGPTSHNAPMVYFTGIRHMTHAYLLKKRGQQPILVHSPIERDEATRTGMQTKNRADYEFLKLLKEAEGDRARAFAMELQRIFEEFDITGRVGIYGKVELSHTLAMIQLLEGMVPDITLVGESDDISVLTRTRSTKDDEEVEKIRKMGKITAAVVADVAGFLTSHQVKDDLLVNRQGDVVTVGDVKRKINLWLAMRDADNPTGSIFAIGRDAGVPHSSGTDDDPITIGQTIVFDIFPTEAGGGYHHDFTRTWCLGYASDEILQVHQDVVDVYETVLAVMKGNTLCRDYQIMACKLFEEKGHPTILSDSKTQEGYIHGLGHGVGLSVHEGPLFSQAESNQDKLLPGTVYTHEPGLYYPDRGFGVRIEDTVWMRPDGTPEVLVEYPKDLVLKI